MRLTTEQLKTLSDAGIIPVGVPDAVIEAFNEACAAHQLNPFRREIHLGAYEDKEGKMHYAMMVGIDGLQQKAARTGRLAGVDVEKYNLRSDGTYSTAAELSEQGQPPTTCTVTVHAIVQGIKCEFTATAVFNEYYPYPKNKSKTMPFNMIAKCARAKALKMAFSDELSGLYIEEEAAAFQDTTINAQVETEKLEEKINQTKSLEELMELFNSNPAYREHAWMFTRRKNQL